MKIKNDEDLKYAKSYLKEKIAGSISIFDVNTSEIINDHRYTQGLSLILEAFEQKANKDN